MPRRTLDNARILVTGASSGIGRELALALARRKARLLLVARRQDLLDGLAAECSALGGAADCVVGDLTDPTVREAAVRRVTESWGGLDVWINNAGTSAQGRFADSDEPTLRRIMEVNFFAATELTRLALPLLRLGRQAAIVNVSSILAHRAVPLNGEYCASKFALRGWSESLRAELAADGIDVLLVSPGTVDSEFFDHLIANRAALPWANAKGITPAAVAAQTVHALERNRREIFPNWRGRALVLANRLLPGLVDRAMKRFGRRP